ncbi:EF-hand domain-containing protein [Tahibacter caeni]|uniref:EF-hand domain-containing protein n=1 Tax=Tahibacter caeni TaxID=1453545 RepID=UPI002148505C|nr:EF-hand domain-containing protein [Tahibacter caeni]
MKILIAVLLCGAAAGAAAQTDGLREQVYPSPRGDIIVRYGQPPAQPWAPKPSFESLDRNGDGSVDENEASGYAPLANDYIYADKNRDGRVSRREYERW